MKNYGKFFAFSEKFLIFIKKVPMNTVENKSIDFAVRIVNLYKMLMEKRETVMSKQLLRSGTSIGANIAEAQHAQSKADFRSKMLIALKEAEESHYWLVLLHRTNYIDEKGFDSINADVDELISLLTSICKNSG